ncbi:MAG: superoxide dismutase [Oscillospiraceae bacterium]|nr:superoxide dismutase [Oscillospiraceae bacterium]
MLERVTVLNGHYPFTLPALPYAHGALMPNIDARMLAVHHEKVLSDSIDALNAALAPYPQFHTQSLEELIAMRSMLPAGVRQTVWENANSIYAHTLFFASMSAAGSGGMPTGMLAGAMRRAFGSIDGFERIMHSTAMRSDGGFVWLCADRGGDVRIVAMPENVVPLPLYPLLCLDLWDHAYTLQYGEDRSAYIENWFPLINWDAVSLRYSELYATTPLYPVS